MKIPQITLPPDKNSVIPFADEYAPLRGQQTPPPQADGDKPKEKWKATLARLTQFKVWDASTPWKKKSRESKIYHVVIVGLAAAILTGLILFEREKSKPELIKYEEQRLREIVSDAMNEANSSSTYDDDYTKAFDILEKARDQIVQSPADKSYKESRLVYLDSCKEKLEKEKTEKLKKGYVIYKGKVVEKRTAKLEQARESLNAVIRKFWLRDDYSRFPPETQMDYEKVTNNMLTEEKVVVGTTLWLHGFGDQYTSMKRSARMNLDSLAVYLNINNVLWSDYPDRLEVVVREDKFATPIRVSESEKPSYWKESLKLKPLAGD